MRKEKGGRKKEEGGRKKEEGGRKKEEIARLVRSLLRPEARRRNLSRKDLFYRLPSPRFLVARLAGFLTASEEPGGEIWIVFHFRLLTKS